MVSPTCFSTTDIGRYSHRGNPYVASSSPYSDRRPGGYAHHDLRSIAMADREMHQEPASQRKRIAVACMRCRKRKIRCTGDDGLGRPCQNCKNAGHEPCQFLRVLSHEAAIKGSEFPYSMDVSRHFQARSAALVPAGPSPLSSPYHDGSMAAMPGGADALSSYRNSAAYAYNGRGASMYSVSGWSTGVYADEAIDYALYQTPTQPGPGTTPGQHQQHAQHTQPSQHHHHQQQAYADTAAGYMLGYRMATKQHGSSASLYMEPDNNNNNNNSNNNTNTNNNTGSLLHRSGSSVTDPGTSYPAFQAVSSSSALTSSHPHHTQPMHVLSERILPAPTPRPLSTTDQHPYRCESISSGYSKTSQSSSNGGSSPAPLSEAVGAYNSYENSPLPTATSSSSLSSQSHHHHHHSQYPSVPLPLPASSLPVQMPLRHGHDIYTTAARAESDEPACMKAAGDFTYKYHDTTSHYRSTYHGGLGLGVGAAGAAGGGGGASGTSYLAHGQTHGGSYLVGPELTADDDDDDDDVPENRKSSSDIHALRQS